MDILNEHALFKKKFLRANCAPYMTKRLRKAIMKRSELKSKYLNIQTQESCKSYKKSSKIFAVDCIRKNGKSTTIDRF